MFIEQIEITQDMIDKTGAHWLDDPTYRGPVSGLKSWANPEFQRMVASLMQKSIVTADMLAQAEADKKAALQQVIADRISVIPALYLKDTNLRYAVQPRAAIRRWGTLQRSPRQAGTLRKSLYIYGKSGRGKSHYAGKLLESIASLGRLCWVNAENLDGIIQKASGGNAEWNRSLAEILDGIAKSKYVVLDDLGKADTKCDGITVPKRIAVLHSMIEDARTNCARQFIVTSEFHPDSPQIRGKLSDGIANRLLEMCDIVHVDEPLRFTEWQNL